ncbi:MULTISPECIES: PaaI family thioesterase [unclassified Nocardioides]|uniref:PaaI family thioesterase n=1 Tax=unclassified Nocardioides TaxID=2615069 RepID=UPI000A85FEB1|nr:MULTISPECIES: PaaI family thioesterase [unclassified Nocardioides]
MSIGGFIHDEIPSEEVDRIEAAYGPLAEAVRELVDATIRTTVPPEEADLALAEIEAVVKRLRAQQLPGPAGVRFNSEGRAWNWGNAVVGLRNAIAPPLDIVHVESGLAHASVTLGAAYEGPPGLVHGGVTALLLDHLMGETAAASFTRITFTGTLTMVYRRGTPLGPLRLDARIDREEGRKVWVVASIGDEEGPTVEAEGVFIIPRWAT